MTASPRPADHRREPPARHEVTALDHEPRVAPLIRRLCSALEAARVRYCHWKSTTGLEHSATGLTDLDLLVEGSSSERFRGLLGSLGFKLAELPARYRIPGVDDFYGYDAEEGRLIHVHAHWQLIFGHDASKSYRLPVEQAYLDSATPRGPFLVPAPEFELLIFVLRMVLKHSTWAALLTGQGRLSATERREHEDLVARADPRRLAETLAVHVPSIPAPLFARCREILEGKASFGRRIGVARALQIRLAEHASRPTWRDSLRVLSWRPRRLARRLLAIPVRRHFASGGAMVALVGGDGAGKTTALNALMEWLTPVFSLRQAHFGKPRWSWTTHAVRGLLKLLRGLGVGHYERFSERYLHPPDSDWVPSYSLMLREICTARDRYLTYRRARRWAARGQLVLTDRYPLPELRQMDGPFLEHVPAAERRNRLVRWLASLEARYYRPISRPDHLFVLQLDPEIAMRRRAQSDSSLPALRARLGEVWQTNWESSSAQLIDAAQSREEVVAELKSRLWACL